MKRRAAALLGLSAALAATPGLSREPAAGRLAGAARFVEEAPGRVRITVPGAHSMRLHFGKPPPGVRLVVEGAGGVQNLDAATLARWSNSSAYFNGEAVVLRPLDGASGAPRSGLLAWSKTVRIETDRDRKPPRAGAVGVVIGVDNRVHSTNPATGRIMGEGCTGWLISTGLALSAGHCFEGVTDPQVLEFNVPPSLPNGTPQHPPPSDQFPIDMTSAVYSWDKFTAGDDWAVFEVGPSAGVPVFEAQGAFFRLTTVVPPAVPASGQSLISVTGYGQDNVPPGVGGGFNAATQTEQVSTASLLGARTTSPNHVVLTYDADTQAGSSGAPVHLPGTLIAIGVHDGGGTPTLCSPDPMCNYGTGLANTDLIAAIASFNVVPGFATVFVDAERPGWVAAPSGSPIAPFGAIADAVAGTTGNIVLNITAGYYAGEGLSVGGGGRTVVLQAVAGPVTLGPVPRPVPAT